jgi:hypothetical protein
MKEIIRGKYRAFSIPLPSVGDRPNKDTVAALDRWCLIMPGIHPAWHRWCIMGCSLATFPGVLPAVKHAPDMTHEIVCCSGN